MACDQLEYCGSCEHYEECKKRAEAGRLESCKVGEQK